MSKFEFSAQNRGATGGNTARKLRREETLPGVVYGAEEDPQSISMSHHQMLQLLRHEDFQASILTMNLDGKAQQVLLRDVQFHPYKRKLVHMDFQRVSDKKEIRVSVPLHFINASEAPGVKLRGGSVSHTLVEVEISCLPKDLPTHIDVDMGAMDVGNSIHVKDLKLSSGVKVVVSGKENPVVCSVLSPRKEEVAAVASAADAVASPAGDAKAGDAKAGDAKAAPAKDKK